MESGTVWSEMTGTVWSEMGGTVWSVIANTIQTSFVRKGRAGKNETQRSQMQSILSKQRATRMEGSFGTEKNHYGLNRVKARTEKTEILWIFFGVMTSNAVKIAKRRKKKRAEELKAQKQVA